MNQNTQKQKELIRTLIWIGANTLAIRKNTVRSVENTQSIDSLATLQEQSEKNSQLIIEMLGAMQTALDEQGKMIEESLGQTQQFIEKMGGASVSGEATTAGESVLLLSLFLLVVRKPAR